MREIASAQSRVLSLLAAQLALRSANKVLVEPTNLLKSFKTHSLQVKREGKDCCSPKKWEVNSKLMSGRKTGLQPSMSRSTNLTLTKRYSTRLTSSETSSNTSEDASSRPSTNQLQTRFTVWHKTNPWWWRSRTLTTTQFTLKTPFWTAT